MEKVNQPPSSVKNNPSDSREKIKRVNTRTRIHNALSAARGGWVPAPALSRIACAYTRNLFELRQQGHIIENRVEMVDGARHGYYRLIERRADNSAHVTLWQGEPA